MPERCENCRRLEKRVRALEVTLKQIRGLVARAKPREAETPQDRIEDACAEVSMWPDAEQNMLGCRKPRTSKKGTD